MIPDDLARAGWRLLSRERQPLVTGRRLTWRDEPRMLLVSERWGVVAGATADDLHRQARAMMRFVEWVRSKQQ